MILRVNDKSKIHIWEKTCLCIVDEWGGKFLSRNIKCWCYYFIRNSCFPFAWEESKHLRQNGSLTLQKTNVFLICLNKSKRSLVRAGSGGPCVASFPLREERTKVTGWNPLTYNSYQLQPLGKTQISEPIFCSLWSGNSNICLNLFKSLVKC